MNIDIIMDKYGSLDWQQYVGDSMGSTRSKEEERIELSELRDGISRFGSILFFYTYICNFIIISN